jgi:hypothetical protein
MTPKDKATQLVNRYHELSKDFTRGVSMQEFSKECALIAVDEIIKVLVDLSNGEFTYIHNVEYMQEVKQEIENL